MGNNPINELDPLGLTRYIWKRCTQGEETQCRAICKSRGKQFESCYWRFGVRSVIRGGKSIPEVYRLPNGMSCSCKDKDDNNNCPPKNPVPFPPLVPGRGPGPAPFRPAPIPFGSGGGCFVSGTLVHTADGLKPIEELKIGDIVLAWNENTSRNEYRRVVALVVAVRRDMVKIYLGSEEEAPIMVSSNHKFYVKEKGWIKASEIVSGDFLLDESSTPVKVRKAEKELYPNEVKVFNIEVEELHNYYIGKDGILTHNKGLKDLF